MKSILPFSLVVALTGCFKQAKAPEAPVRKGAQSSDQCGTTPAPSDGAYLAGVKGTWQEVKTLIERDCASCHPTYTDYETAKLVADKLVKTTDDGTMPKGGDRLSLEDRTAYIMWWNAGAPNDGEAGGGGTGTGTDEGADPNTAAQPELPADDPFSPDEDDASDDEEQDGEDEDECV